MATRRYGTIVRHLTDDPETAVELAAKLPDEILHHLAEALHDEARRRAIKAGDHAALIADTFDTGFAGDGMGVDPWIQGQVIVCPGALVAKSRSSHRCRFVSVDDVWIWESGELLEEEKRSNPGADGGFRAVALLPVINGMKLDVVSGRARSGQHNVDRVTSFAVRRGKLVEVSRRNVNGRGMK
jgi:hypothetical protein